MNKIVTLFCFALLSGCVNPADDQQKKITIGFSQCTISDDWRRTMLEEMRREIGFHPEYDINLIVTDAGNDSKKQIEDVNGLLNQKIDILIISPNEAEPLTDIVGKVYDSGIPVIIIDRRINSEKFTAYIGGDNLMIGKEAAIFANQLLNGKGRILEISGLYGSTPAAERSAGFKDELKKFPEIRVVKTVLGAWQEERAGLIVDTLLKTWKEFDLIFAHNDRMAYGAYMSASKHKMNPYIIGVDGLHTPGDGIDMVIDGKISGTFLYPTGGDKALDLALKVFNGEQYAKFNYLQTSKIDYNNARAFKLQGMQLTDQALRIDGQRMQIGQLAFLLKKKDTLFLVFAMLSGLLLSLVGLCGYLIIQKNRANRALDLQKQTIQTQNRQITEQRDKLIRTLRVAEEATEAKIRFFINVSHEIKTVLSLISISNQEQESEEKNPKVNSLKRSISKLLTLSEEIMNYRHLNYCLKTALSDLARCLNNIVKVFEENAIQKGIILISEFPPKMEATFDASIVEKIMFNLISNAIKYTNRGGEVKVKASVSDNLIKISVQDTGVGISEEELPFIFERFYRGGSGRSNNGEQGNGIGLDFTRELIQLHGGTIDVCSKVGEGSSFSITLQQKVSSAKDHEIKLGGLIHHEQQDYLAHPMKKTVVLVVEDSDELRNYMDIMLSKYFTVITACNGAEGLEKAKALLPDIIVSDILMPEKDGIELCFDIKNDPATFSIPIILLTAMDSENSFIRSFETGADAYLSKPCNERVLLSRINNLVKSRNRLKKEYDKPAFAFIELKSREKHDEEFINNCLDEIHKGISDPGFTLEHLCKRVGMSRSSFYRRIKDVTGLKAVDFLRKAKLNYASKLLLKSDMTVSEIAWESGFSDVKYFSKIFTKEFGKLPSKFHDHV